MFIYFNINMPYFDEKRVYLNKNFLFISNLFILIEIFKRLNIDLYYIN